ncbi:MAG TPA: redoxin family protein [Thermomicrobiales bacterium]|nr:redoxin family protein [Thermomicrobiales bacterium]
MTAAFTISLAVLWVVVIILFLIVVGLVRSVYDLRRQVAVAIGEPRRAPHFRAPTLDGGEIDTRQINKSPYALIFVTPDCASCRQAVTRLGPVRKRVGDNIVILCNGDTDRSRDLAALVDPTVRFGLDEGGAVGKAFGVTSSPMTVVVDEEGQIRSVGSIIGDEPPGPDSEPELVVAAGIGDAPPRRP